MAGLVMFGVALVTDAGEIGQDPVSFSFALGTQFVGLTVDTAQGTR